MSTRDDDKVAYYSGWDIDQLIDSDEVAVPAGDTILYAFAGQPLHNVVQFLPDDAPTKWFEPGTNSVDNTEIEVFSFYTYIDGNALRIVIPAPGRVRYYIYGDKINYA